MAWDIAFGVAGGLLLYTVLMVLAFSAVLLIVAAFERKGKAESEKEKPGWRISTGGNARESHSEPF